MQRHAAATMRYHAVMLANKPCVLAFGATGLFGELLVRRLAGAKQFTVVGLARNKTPLDNLQLATGILTELVAVSYTHLTLPTICSV